ncbi:MAG TPA: hypothetical protein VGD30_04015 [Telluria sp.]
MQASKSSGRLGTRFRGKLAAAYGIRGHQNSSLWYVYSPRTDKDWVICSDLYFDHFVLTEADPAVVDVEYSPNIELPDSVSLSFAAIVHYTDEVVQWHYVSSESEKPNRETTKRLRVLEDAAEHAGAHLQCFDRTRLYEHDLRRWNWQRAIAWMSAARGFALAPYMTELAAFIHAHRTVALADIAALGSSELFPLYIAAAFRLVQGGQLLSDLDDAPLSMLTTFSTRARA